MSRRRKNNAQRRPIANSGANLTRRISHINGDAYRLSTKHDHAKDFGWPENLGFAQFYRMYCRNSIAAAVVEKTVSKTWQDDPQIWETEEATKSKIEEDIRSRFEDLRVWQQLAEADRRGMVGRYSAIILRIGDGKPFDQPVEKAAGLPALKGIIPAWESQLYPVQWDQDVNSESYGLPTMFQFSEAQITDANNSAPRSFAVHPDRVIIWSADGTVVGRSRLESIYNDLIDVEKIKGAGGEGFWKSSRGALTVEAPEGMNPAQLAQSMQTDVAGLRAKLNDQVDDFQSGFDKMLMLGGMTARPISITLPSPEHFFAGPIQSICASWLIPMRELMGSQSGQRASDEDSRQWALTCNSRRVNFCKPLIREMLNRFEKWGIIPERDWVIGWQDLTESTAEAKMDRAFKMQDINAKTAPGDIAPFSPAEIRIEAGFDPNALPDDQDLDDPATGDIPDDTLEDA